MNAIITLLVLSSSCSFQFWRVSFSAIHFSLHCCSGSEHWIETTAYWSIASSNRVSWSLHSHSVDSRKVTVRKLWSNFVGATVISLLEWIVETAERKWRAQGRLDRSPKFQNRRTLYNIATCHSSETRFFTTVLSIPYTHTGIVFI